MLRSLSLVPICVLLASGNETVADPKRTAPSPAPSCYVLNNTDHVVRLRHDLPVYEWEIFYGTQTVMDGKQKLDLVCDKPDARMKLVGSAGALTVEPLLSWFGAGSNSDGTIWVTTNKKKGAKVEVDGEPITLRKGDGTRSLDLRAKLLAADVATMFDPSAHGWTIPVRVKATAGKETADYLISADTYRAMQKLLQELLAAEKTPVAWAAAPDHAGPAIVFGCMVAWKRQAQPDYDLVRSPSTVTSLSMVAVCEPKYVTVETCPPSTDKFAQGERVRRARIDGEVKLVEAKTSKVVAVATLRGGDPAACRDTATKDIDGEAPSKREILTWINTVK